VFSARQIFLVLGSLLLGAPQASPQETQAPFVMLQDGNSAYLAQNWDQASQLFQRFLDTYAADPTLADPVKKVQPLLALAYFRLGEFDKAAVPSAAALQDPGIDPAVRAELRFFGGLGALRTNKFEEARTQLGAVFNDPKVDASRRMEALILGGTSYVMEENWTGAANFFTKYGREIRSSSPEAGGRADILHLHSLMKAARWDDAIVLAQDVSTRMDQVRQVATFSSLLIELGSHFIDENQPYKALGVLRYVRSRADILTLQNAKITEAEADLQYATASKNSVRQSQITASLAEMRKDLQSIEAIPQFDSASRLRIAQAYVSLGRIREASLILDQMVRQMPPDELVESASVNLISGWMSLERWNRAAKAADVYVERIGSLPIAKSLPGVLFARAQALEGQFEYAQAAQGYADVAQKFPADPLVPQARFMQAYNVLQLEQYKEAGQLLDALIREIPSDHAMWEHAFFWRAMVDYFDQQWDPARSQLADYLKRAASGAGNGQYIDDAIFRRGYAYFSEALYEPAIKELLKLEKEHPTSEWLPEALLTLGDSHGAIGDLDEAIQAYKRISVEAEGFHDEGWMKRGQIFKMRKDLDGMKALYEDFLKLRPKSPRIAEALNWLGWVAKQKGDIASARKIYWDSIRKLGNDQVRPGLEDIFLGLNTLYPGDQKIELRGLLEQERLGAETKRQSNYAVRLGWAEAQLLLRGEPEESKAKLLALGSKVDPEKTAPRIIVDCAEALAAAGNAKEAERLFEGLRKWYPRAPERDRAFAGLGFLALNRGEEAQALAMFDRFEKTAVMPKSAPDANGISIVEAEIGGKVALARAGLLETRERDRALHLYSAVQKSKALPSRLRAEAFLGAAALHAKRGQVRESLPFYEQVYVLFNRYPDLVAKAYWGRGQALEKLGSPELAREVYSELASREDLKATPEATQGRARAVALGGVLEPKVPEGGEIPPAEATTKS